MITIFCSPKPFVGVSRWNQSNALRSWRSIHPLAEILVFGAVPGAEEAAKEVDAVLVPEIELSLTGAPSFNSMAQYARFNGRYDLQIYVNADILLNVSILKAIQKVAEMSDRFLLVGERVDFQQGLVLDARQPNWNDSLSMFAKAGHLSLQGPSAVDYFGFRRGMWNQLAPVFMGRSLCDQALIHYCLCHQIPIVDATLAVLALHQFHGYSHVRGGRQEVFSGEDRASMSNGHGLYHSVPTIADAGLRFSSAGEVVRSDYRGSVLRRLELVLRYKWGLKWASFFVRALQYLRGRSAVASRVLSMSSILSSWEATTLARKS